MYLSFGPRAPHATHHCPKPCRAAIEADEAGGSSRGLPAEVSMRRLDVSDDEASPRDSLVSVSLNNPSGGDKPPPPSDAPSGTPAAWKAEPNQLKRALARKSRFYYMSVNSMPVQGLELCGNQPPRGFGQFTLPRPTSASSSQRAGRGCSASSSLAEADCLQPRPASANRQTYLQAGGPPRYGFDI